MTDLEKFTSLYKSLGIDLIQDQVDGELVLFLNENGREESGEKLIGYSGFYSVITFDKDGNFISQGFWE